MSRIRFFYTPKHKQFNYQPLYYDEQKEELQKRIEIAKQELGLKSDQEPYVSNIKGQIRGAYQRKGRSAKRSSGIRLLVILVVLFILFYFLIFA